MDAATLQQMYSRALDLHQAGRLGEAQSLYGQILSKYPNHADTHQMLGVLAHQTGRSDEGIRLLQRAIALDTSVASYHANLGVILKAIKRLDEAVASYRRALALSPDFPQALSGLAAALYEQRKLDEAITFLSQAAALSPQQVQSHIDLGTALREAGRLDEAINQFHQALALQPANPVARWSLGFTQLLKGDFTSGWSGLEARWTMKRLDPRRGLQQPLWDASELSGRRLLLWAEQGLGDTIQFVRYVPQIIRRGGRVVVQCQPELQRLLRVVEGVEEVVSFSDIPPHFHVHVPIMSLSRLFQTTASTIPRGVPYLRGDDSISKAWQERLGERSGFRIGLVWAGSPTHKNDRMRSIPLTAIAPLAQVPGIQIYSLQKGPASEQLRRTIVGQAVSDWTEELTDLADTAALVSNLDLVITVDTAIAHLAGALAKPVWVLLPFAPDWRWMLGRDDSPWYPTMRLFRQPRPGDWETPIDAIRRELTELARKPLQFP